MRQWNNHKFICNLIRTTELWIDESRRNGRKGHLTTKVVKKILCHHSANHFIKILQKQQKKISFNWLRTMHKHWKLLCKMSKEWNKSEKLKWPLKPYKFSLSLFLTLALSQIVIPLHSERLMNVTKTRNYWHIFLARSCAYSEYKKSFSVWKVLNICEFHVYLFDVCD